MENTLVFVDIGYLKLIAEEFTGASLSSIDVNRLSMKIAREQGLWCKKLFCYLAPPYQGKSPTKEEKSRKARYDKLVNALGRWKGAIVREGRCQKIGRNFREKGVDTLMTIDLVTRPIKENAKTVILLTCDTDFVPAMEYIRSELQTKVIIYYYADRKRHSKFSMSNHILAACDKSVMLTKRHFEACLLQESARGKQTGA